MARKKKEEIVDTSQKEEKLKAPKTISPFDIIKYIFTDANEFNKLSNLTLERNFFMINRIFSIKYPAQAVVFNNTKINEAEVIKCWARFLVSKEGYGKVPYFVYTKGAKRSEEAKSKVISISKDTKMTYCKRYHISLKDFEDLLEMFNEEIIADALRYEKLISIKEQEKNILKQK